MSRLIALVLLVLVPLLAGCSGSEPDSEPEAARHTAPDGSVYNDADVAFATEMVQHHAEGLAMVDLTRGRELSPETSALAEQILASQAPEIEQMTRWLTEWGEEVPETIRDHANAGHGEHGGGESGHAMPGMEELEAAQGEEFERLWLESMIEHHEGAVEMAVEEQEDGVFGPAVELAESIETTQQAEIEEMEGLL